MQGKDPANVGELIFQHFARLDCIIILTSHNFEDIEQLCDVIYIIEDGSLKIISEEEIKRDKRR